MTIVIPTGVTIVITGGTPLVNHARSAANLTGHGQLSATAVIYQAGFWNWVSWLRGGGGAPFHYPPPVSYHEFATPSGHGALKAKVVPKIGASFTGVGQLSMLLNSQLQHSAPNLRSTGMLVAGGHTTLGATSGTGLLTASAVATAWELPTGTPPLPTLPTTIFERLPTTWQNLETKVVWIGVDGSFWNLHGNYAGQEGLTLAPHLTGFMHSPFASIFSEGPYQIGGFYERTDYKKREINLGVMVGIDYGPDTSSWKYRMLEQAWWRSWSASQEGYLCCYTRTHGWRFLRLRLGESPKTPIDLDPTAFGNNFMQWDIIAVATQPFWQKKMITDTWTNDQFTATPVNTIVNEIQALINQFLGGLLQGQGGTLLPGKDVGHHTFNIWNNGDFPAFPKFLVSTPGVAWIQDGPGGNMLQLPTVTEPMGSYLVDTDPTNRVITAPSDPNDILLFQKNSVTGLTDLLLSPTSTANEPLWKQFKLFFTTPMPPSRSLGGAPPQPSALEVFHSDQSGTIQIFVPQQFDKAYG
jgi:hypothetical protein